MRYKVWHKNREEWVHDSLYVYVDPDGDVLLIDEGEFGIMYKQCITDDVTLCRSTGLTDRNGKEIYEGDLVKSCHRIHDDGIALLNKVEFKDYCWRFIAVSEKNAHDAPIGLYAREPQSLEVIGNVWENSELLKGE